MLVKEVLLVGIVGGLVGIVILGELLFERLDDFFDLRAVILL